MNDKYQTPTGAMNGVGLLESIKSNIGKAEYVLKMHGHKWQEAVDMLQVHMPTKTFKVLCTVSRLGQPDEEMKIRGVQIIVIDSMKDNFAIYQLVGKE